MPASRFSGQARTLARASTAVPLASSPWYATQRMAVTRALVSVSDKTGLVPFVQRLVARGVEVLSTGGTAKTLRDAGVTVTDVSKYTQSPEIMDGRVKTLHPRVHGGILMRDRADDREQLRSVGGLPIDLVVVNLYPFARTLANPASTYDDIVENIDIGGPAMVRSAAKNHARVAVVVDPRDYDRVIAAIEAGGDLTFRERQTLAAKAYAHTAGYDAAIAEYMTSLADDGSRDPLPGTLAMTYERAYALRYGENPHQSGAFYVQPDAASGTIARAESVGAGGKELSFNNLVDVDAALEAVREFTDPACVVVKHTNPCGVAVAHDAREAYRLARDADPVSAFGGIVALNRPVDAGVAEFLAEIFLECVVAPSFEPAALDILRAKKNLRLLAVGAMLPASSPARMLKQVSGGMLVQQRDASADGEVERARTATKRAPTDDERRALSFAWRVCKHVKSNAIVLARSDANGVVRTVGVGAGQMSRVVSVEIAVKKAGELARGAVLASDAFFPFPDGVEAAARAGVVAIAQPGGSVKDAEVTAAADAAGLAMVHTGVRHFRH